MLLSLIIIAGHIMWYLESTDNSEEFSPIYITGVGDGMWWALVTLSTVGYGDRLVGKDAPNAMSYSCSA